MLCPLFALAFTSNYLTATNEADYNLSKKRAVKVADSATRLDQMFNKNRWGEREQGSVKALVLCSAVYTNHEAVSKTNDAVYQVV